MGACYHAASCAEGVYTTGIEVGTWMSIERSPASKQDLNKVRELFYWVHFREARVVSELCNLCCHERSANTTEWKNEAV